MTSTLKKAGSAIRRSIRSRRYATFDAKENNYTDSPSNFRRMQSAPGILDVAGAQVSDEMDHSGPRSAERPTHLQRSATVTQSMRQAVGTIRNVRTPLVYC